MKYPEIRFSHPWLLMDAIYPDIKAAYELPKDELFKLDYKFIDQTLKRYEKAWRPYEASIVSGMCEILELEFRQNIIDIYAAPFYYSFSNPMFIATKYTSERVVEVITHEILHRLLTDNLQTPYGTHYSDEWKKIFGDHHDVRMLIHIPVHAMLQSLFDDVLKEPQRTTHDIDMCANHQTYKDAWSYVDEVGYEKIVDQVRQSYSRLSTAQYA